MNAKTLYVTMIAGLALMLVSTGSGAAAALQTEKTPIAFVTEDGRCIKILSDTDLECTPDGKIPKWLKALIIIIVEWCLDSPACLGEAAVGGGTGGTPDGTGDACRAAASAANVACSNDVGADTESGGANAHAGTDGTQFGARIGPKIPGGGPGPYVPCDMFPEWCGGGFAFAAGFN